MIKRIFALLLIVGGCFHLLAAIFFIAKYHILRPNEFVIGVAMIAFGYLLSTADKPNPPSAKKPV